MTAPRRRLSPFPPYCSGTVQQLLDAAVTAWPGHMHPGDEGEISEISNSFRTDGRTVARTDKRARFCGSRTVRTVFYLMCSVRTRARTQGDEVRGKLFKVGVRRAKARGVGESRQGYASADHRPPHSKTFFCGDENSRAGAVGFSPWGALGARAAGRGGARGRRLGIALCAALAGAALAYRGGLGRGRIDGRR